MRCTGNTSTPQLQNRETTCTALRQGTNCVSKLLLLHSTLDTACLLPVCPSSLACREDRSSNYAWFAVLPPGPAPLRDPSLCCSFPGCDGSEGTPETCRCCGQSKLHQKCLRDSGLIAAPFPRNCHACILARLASGNLTPPPRQPRGVPPSPSGTPVGGSTVSATTATSGVHLP